MKKVCFILLILIAVSASDMRSQVTINPGTIFIDPLSKAGSAELHNTSNDINEVEIKFLFAYESFNDTLNQISLIRDDSALKKIYDLEPYVRVFPKKIILQPRSKQMIRFLIKNANALEDGTYWTRIVIQSKKHEKGVDSTEPEEFTAKIITWYNMSFPLYYQKGKLTTELNIVDPKITRFKEATCLEMNMEKTGNSPFWGVISLDVFDDAEGDKPVERIRQLLPIFKNHVRRFVIDESKYTSGKKYRVEISVTNDELPDIIHIPVDRIIEMGEYSKEFDFIAP